MMCCIRRTVAQVQAVRRAAEGMTGTEADRARRALPRLAELQEKLVTAGGRYPTPMLADQIAFLYNVTLAADQKLGRDVYERYDELSGQLAQIKFDFEVLMGSR